jgi:hypothetical protein
MSVERRRQIIEPGHPKLSVVRQCELVSISRSGFYYQPTGETPLNLMLMRLIDEQFLETPWYGSRQMARHLRREGYAVGRKRVRRLMARMGLEPIYQRPRTTVPHPEHQVYPYLLRELVIDRPNQVWCADITYIPMRRGFLYLVAVMDWATRKVGRGGYRTRWTSSFALRHWRKRWLGSGGPRFSTPIRGASLHRRGLPAFCGTRGCVFPWTDAGVGWITCLSSGSGAA